MSETIEAPRRVNAAPPPGAVLPARWTSAEVAESVPRPTAEQMRAYRSISNSPRIGLASWGLVDALGTPALAIKLGEANTGVAYGSRLNGVSRLVSLVIGAGDAEVPSSFRRVGGAFEEIAASRAMAEKMHPQRGAAAGMPELEDFVRVAETLASLIVVASLMSPETAIDLELANPGDGLRPLREMGPEWTRRFAIWAHEGQRVARDVDEWTGLLFSFRRNSGSRSWMAHPGAGILGWPGANGYFRVTDLHEHAGGRISAFLHVQGRDESEMTEDLATKIEGEALVAARVAMMLPRAVLADLSATYGEEDTLQQLRVEGPGWAEGFLAFAKPRGRISDVSRWEQELRAYRATLKGGMCFSVGFDSPKASTQWVEQAWCNGNGWFPASDGGSGRSTVHTAVEKLQRSLREVSSRDAARALAGLNLSTLDLAQEQVLPPNSRVKSVAVQPSGRVRIIMRTPIRATRIHWRGRTYAEEPGANVLTAMSIAAFELDFSNIRAGADFPNAYAFRDRDCNSPARHCNIGSRGLICLGNLPNSMTAEEVRQLGGLAMPSIGDLITMLEQINLDSPHHSDTEFVFARPREEPFRSLMSRNEWNDVPGLRRLDVEISADARERARRL